MKEKAQKIRDEIKGVVDFTCSYWWPAWEVADKDKENTPTAAAIISDIIDKRSRYVAELRTKLHEMNELHECTLGCKYYHPSHSITVDGACNMGCC